jgi:hypothetical protein
MEINKETNKKSHAPAKFVRLPDGSFKVVSVKSKTMISPAKVKEKPKLSGKLAKKFNAAAGRLKKTKPNITKKSSLVALTIGLLLVAGICALLVVVNKKPDRTTATKVLGSTNTDTKCPYKNEKPDFKILFPSGKSEKSLGGVCRTSPQSSAPVFTYRDLVVGAKIKVNQQEIPKNLDTEEGLASFAKQNYYNETFEVDNIMVYAGSDSKGAQYLAMVKNGVFIIIQAEKKQDTLAWVKYISSLK